ncbi:MAG: hypothetical protein FVQ81_13790 [Candidatus Glassbacteria bacterium]|nr:hypothetical protein [Candidatus Glassbacteria bacterium]
MQERKLSRHFAVFAVSLLVSLSACGGGVPQPQAAAESPSPDWVSMGPGGGGSTFFPTFHPTDPERIAIRCDMTGCYLTDNGGESWEMYNLPGGVGAFAFDPSNTTTVYVGAAGLHRTVDYGESWELLFPLPADTLGRGYEDDHADFDWVVREGASYPADASRISAILIDPADPATIYLGLTRGSGSSVFVSRDSGAGWSELTGLKAAVLGLYAGPREIDKLYAFTPVSLAVIDPASGETDEMDLPEEMAPVESASGGVDPESGTMRFYAVVTPRGGGPGGVGGNEVSPGGIFISHDAGASWREVSATLSGMASVPENQVRPSFAWVSTGLRDSRTAYLVCARYMDTNPRGNVGHWYGIFKTTDAGESWAWVQKAGGGSSDYTVRDGYKAENVDDSWVREAFAGEYVRAICTGVFPSDPSIAAFTDWYRVMKTTDGGCNWQALYSETLPDGSIRSRGMDVTTIYGVHFDPFDPAHIAVSYTDIAYWHSFDSGRSWRRSVEGVPPRWDNTCYWMEFDPAVRGRVWSAWSSWHDIPKLKMIRSPRWKRSALGGICVSGDGGRSWEVSSEGLPQAPVTWVVMDPKSPAGNRTLYAAVYGRGVYKSSDDAKSWSEASEGIGENRNAFELTLDADGALWLVVTFDVKFSEPRELLSGALYRSDDGAGSWRKVELPAGVNFPNSLESDPLDPNRLYLACWASVNRNDFRGGPGVIKSEGGVLASTDNGKTWTQLYRPDAYVYAVAADPRKAGRLYLNTFMHHAAFSADYGASWQRMAGYDFHWGHRVVPDPHSADKVYLTTFGGSFLYGTPVAAQ